MRRQDILVLIGIIILVGFSFYAAIVGSDFHSKTTPMERLLQTISGSDEDFTHPASTTAAPHSKVVEPSPRPANFEVIKTPAKSTTVPTSKKAGPATIKPVKKPDNDNDETVF